MRSLSILLPCLVLAIVAFALRGVPAVEPARAAALPSPRESSDKPAPQAEAGPKGTAPAVGPSEVKSGQARAADGNNTALAKSGRDPVLQNCRVELIQGVDVPGLESGMLMVLEAKEGMDVTQSRNLGHIDDREPKMQRTISKLKHDAAKAKADSDTEVVYAHDAWQEAKFEVEQNQKAIRLNAKAVTQIDLAKLRLAEAKAKAAWEKAKIDQQQAVFEADTKEAEVQAADISIDRRQLRAPFDGIVTNVYRHPGEWVAPGDPVFKVIQVNPLRIEASLSAAEFDPHEIEGRPVTIETELAHGRREKFPGKIVFVSPEVSLAGEHVVFAEVNNRQENGLWVLSPGLSATMVIHMK